MENSKDTDHSLSLPTELWLQVFQYLDDTAEDIRSLASVAKTSSLFRDIAHDESLWIHIVKRWDPWRHDPMAPSATWRRTFAEQVFWNRTIHLPETTKSIYQWGAGYECTITKIVFEPLRLRVFIDERGTGELGEIQEPSRSRLYCQCTDATKYRFTVDSSMEIADPMSRYVGWLLYSTARIKKDAVISFQYGSGGYKYVEIASLTPEFIQQHRLQHVLATNTANKVEYPAFDVEPIYSTDEEYWDAEQYQQVFGEDTVDDDDNGEHQDDQEEIEYQQDL